MSELLVPLIDIADAVVYELNYGNFGPTDAVRRNVMRRDRKDLDFTCITVVPFRQTTTALTRTSSIYRVEVKVGVQCLLNNREPDFLNINTDDVIKLANAIFVYFQNGKRLKQLPAICVDREFGASSTDTPWLAENDEDQGLIYTGVIKLTFEVIMKCR